MSKSCGSCSLCCQVLEIPELAKPAGQVCVHVVAGRGCGVYADRPAPCRTFTCGWLATAALGEVWRPDVAGFLIRDERDLGHICIDVDPARPGAWRAAPYLEQVTAWSRMVWERTGCLLIYDGERTTVVFPEEEIDIGRFGNDQRLMVGYRRVAGVQRPMVRLMEGEAVAREWLGQNTRKGRLDSEEPR